jgi:DNA endonuclease
MEMSGGRGMGGEWKTRHDAIPLELVDALYFKTLELATEGLGPARIASQIREIYFLSVSPGTLRHWIVGDRKPERNTRRRNIFKQEQSRALSYIIGANIGDGCTLTKNWCVKLEVTDFDFALAFNNSMTTLFLRTNSNRILTRTGIDRLPLHVVKYCSRQLAKLLRLPLRMLLELAFVYPSDFLRGFFDAEGHVDVRVTGNKFTASAGVENSNIRLLRSIKKILLTKCQIRSIVNRKRRAGSPKVIRGKAFRMRKTSFTLLINRVDDLRKFAVQIGFSIARKNQKLADALSVIAKYRPNERAERWAQNYFKSRGEWVRRYSQTLNESKILMKD